MRTTFNGRRFGALCRVSAATPAVALTAATAAHAEDTIKIGVLLIDTGPLAGLKETQTKAVNLAIEQINAAGGAAGKKLEPVFITYAGTPDTAVDGATRAVQKDGAIFLTGMDTSAVSPALSAKLASLNALMVEVYAQADALTGKGCNPNFFRANVNESMLMNAVGDFLKDKSIKSWDIIAVDYSSGRDAAAKFQALVKAQGGSIGKVLFAPFGTADFARRSPSSARTRPKDSMSRSLAATRPILRSSRRSSACLASTRWWSAIPLSFRRFCQRWAIGAWRPSDAGLRARRGRSASGGVREGLQGKVQWRAAPLYFR